MVSAMNDYRRPGGTRLLASDSGNFCMFAGAPAGVSAWHAAAIKQAMFRTWAPSRVSPPM